MRSRHKTETFSCASFSYADKSNIKKITNLAMENKTIYQSPVCDVAMIRIEHGFAVS